MARKANYTCLVNRWVVYSHGATNQEDLVILIEQTMDRLNKLPAEKQNSPECVSIRGMLLLNQAIFVRLNG